MIVKSRLMQITQKNKHPPLVPKNCWLPRSLAPGARHHGDPVHWHFNSCETLVNSLTCFSHYSSSSQDHAPSLRANNSDQSMCVCVCEGEMWCRLIMCPWGATLKAPEQWGASYLKPSQMSAGTFNNILLGLERQPSWWPEQTHSEERDKQCGLCRHWGVSSVS